MSLWPGNLDLKASSVDSDMYVTWISERSLDLETSAADIVQLQTLIEPFNMNQVLETSSVDCSMKDI